MTTISSAEFRERTVKAEELLRKVRLEMYPLDPHDLAIRVGVSVGTIFSFRSGRTVWPRPNTLFGILKAMGYELTLTKVETDGPR